MRILLLITAIVFASSALAREAVEVDFRCLSTGGDKPIQLEWRTFSEPQSDWSAAYIKYKKSKHVIHLIPKSSTATEIAPDRPYEFTTVWTEIVNGRISGEYEITSQGANIDNFSYKNFRTGQKIFFMQDDGAYAELECIWD